MYCIDLVICFELFVAIHVSFRPSIHPSVHPSITLLVPLRLLRFLIILLGGWLHHWHWGRETVNFKFPQVTESDFHVWSRFKVFQQVYSVIGCSYGEMSAPRVWKLSQRSNSIQQWWTAYAKAVVLAPTRELCSQIHLEVGPFSASPLHRNSEIQNVLLPYTWARFHSISLAGKETIVWVSGALGKWGRSCWRLEANMLFSVGFLLRL